MVNWNMYNDNIMTSDVSYLKNSRSSRGHRRRIIIIIIIRPTTDLTRRLGYSLDKEGSSKTYLSSTATTIKELRENFEQGVLLLFCD